MQLKPRFILLSDNDPDFELVLDTPADDPKTQLEAMQTALDAHAEVFRKMGFKLSLKMMKSS
jgi:hypothetical protein